MSCVERRTKRPCALCPGAGRWRQTRRCRPERQSHDDAGAIAAGAAAWCREELPYGRSSMIAPSRTAPSGGARCRPRAAPEECAAPRRGRLTKRCESPVEYGYFCTCAGNDRGTGVCCLDRARGQSDPAVWPERLCHRSAHWSIDGLRRGRIGVGALSLAATARCRNSSCGSPPRPTA